MNKYQKYILDKVLATPFDKLSANSSYDGESDCLTVTQDEDITVTKYSLTISLREDYAADVLGISVLKAEKWQSVENDGNTYTVTVDFDDRIEKIRFAFKNDLADDYVLNVKYVEADKEKYYARQEQKRKDDLLKAASIKHSTGNDLVNIYFQPCCDRYERTEITLYRDGQMLAKYKVDDGVFFKSIGGLAYGTYEYVVKQFGKDNNVLLETDKFRFSIDRPNYGGHGMVNVNGNW